MKIPIIIAIVLICVGLLLGFFALLSVKFDVRLLSNVQYDEKTQVMTDSFSDIVISADTHDVRILPSDDGSVRVVYHELSSEKVTVNVSVQDGKLSIVEEDTRRWYQKISIFNFARHGITVYLPAGVYGALDIDISTGKIVVEKGFSFAKARVERSTGSLRLDMIVAGELNIKGSTGDLSLKGAAGSLQIKQSTGDVELSDLTVSGQMQISTTTGEIDMTRVTAAAAFIEVDTGDIEAKGLTVSGDMAVESNTGDIELDHSLIGGHLEIESDTGDVSLDESDVGTAKITTDTGDVTGKLLTDKQYFATTDTGRVRVPTTAGGLVEIHTDTGNINFLGDD